MPRLSSSSMMVSSRPSTSPVVTPSTILQQQQKRQQQRQPSCDQSHDIHHSPTSVISCTNTNMQPSQQQRHCVKGVNALSKDWKLINAPTKRASVMTISQQSQAMISRYSRTLVTLNQQRQQLPLIDVTEEQIQQYERDGFIIIEKYVFLSDTQPLISLLNGVHHMPPCRIATEDLVAKLREKIEPLFAGNFETGVYPDEV